MRVNKIKPRGFRSRFWYCWARMSNDWVYFVSAKTGQGYKLRRNRKERCWEAEEIRWL